LHNNEHKIDNDLRFFFSSFMIYVYKKREKGNVGNKIIIKSGDV